MALDETAPTRDELCTVLQNKSAHGKKGAIAAMIDGTNPDEICKHLLTVDKEIREKVKEVTVDFSSSMRRIVKTCFPNAMITVDLFHLIQLVSTDLQDLRVHLKRQAKREETKLRKAHEKKLAQRRKNHAESVADGTRGRKPKRINEAFEPQRLQNGDTICELLTRSRYLLAYTPDEWSEHQKERAKILFDMYPQLKTAYDLVHKLRTLFKNKRLTKETAKPKLEEWCTQALDAKIDEFVATVQTIQEREDEILNYFVNFQTNAAAESFNAKIKHFRAQLRGVSNKQFFLYRLCTLYC